jgi:hypothetical protein
MPRRRRHRYQADVLSAADLPRIRALKPKSILCCNILEHVVSPKTLAQRCSDIVGAKGLIAVTVPYSYPHHRDPIDTMFRPSPAELAALFAPAAMLKGEIIDVGESYRGRCGSGPGSCSGTFPVFLSFHRLQGLETVHAEALLAVQQLPHHRRAL